MSVRAAAAAAATAASAPDGSRMRRETRSRPAHALRINGHWCSSGSGRCISSEFGLLLRQRRLQRLYDSQPPTAPRLAVGTAVALAPVPPLSPPATDSRYHLRSRSRARTTKTLPIAAPDRGQLVDCTSVAVRT